MGSCKFMLWKWLQKREVCPTPKPGFVKDTTLYKDLYSSVKAINSWEAHKNNDPVHPGGIFNFDYSTDGSLLVAACEKQSILMFDPFNGKLAGYRNKAHTDCVNCVRFLDTRVFATCSDDTTVALWDARFLKQKIRTLTGHSNMVKSIEYANGHGLLLTSDFDGSVYTWDINSYKCHEDVRTLIFHTDALMRSKLTPGSSKLILATAQGYLIIIHDLDLQTMASDLHDFTPNSPQTSWRVEPSRRESQEREIGKKRNRVEFIHDFPQENQAEVIASVQVHPQGWCIVSRNSSVRENSEWTCVHDIQDLPVRELNTETRKRTDEQSTHGAENSRTVNSDLQSMSGAGSSRALSIPGTAAASGFSPSTLQLYGQLINDNDDDDVDDNSESDSSDNEFTNYVVSGFSNLKNAYSDSDTRQNPMASEDRGDNSDDPPVSETLNSGEASFSPSNSVDEEQTLHSADDLDDSSGSGFDNASNPAGLVLRNLLLPFSSWLQDYSLGNMSPFRPLGRNPFKPKNICPRLLHFTEEANVGRGFIKEICFSNDGRIICSPFGHGVRLLAFDPECHELCDCVPQVPVKLYEVCSNISHSNVVVTTKFSPVHNMYVSGCLSGKVVFHQPVL